MNPSRFFILSIRYQPDATTRLEVRLQDETVWLTQQQMAELFDSTIPNVSMHIRNVYKEGELDKGATVKDFLIVQNEGGRQVTRRVQCYNLDVSEKDFHALRDAHNATAGVEPIDTFVWGKPSHDRWLIIDDTLYHCGHSLKDMGQKLSAISLMGTPAQDIIDQIK